MSGARRGLTASPSRSDTGVMDHPPTSRVPPTQRVEPVPEVKKSSTLRIVAIITGVLGLIVAGGIGVVVFVIMPALQGVTDSAREAVAMANLSQAALSLQMYANDHEGQYPESREDWKMRLTPYLRGPFTGLTRTQNGKPVRMVYVPPSAVAGEGQDALPADQIVLVHEDPDLLPPGSAVLAAFLDGSARRVSREEFRRLMLGRE